MRKKVPVSPRALLQRLNRVLKKSGLLLKKSKPSQTQLGHYYVIDTKNKVLMYADADLEGLGRKHKVLAAWEELC